jgi:hypothetical protein
MHMIARILITGDRRLTGAHVLNYFPFSAIILNLYVSSYISSKSKDYANSQIATDTSN